MDKSDRIYHLWDEEDGIFEEEETDWGFEPVYRAVCGFRTTNLITFDDAVAGIGTYETLGNEQVIYNQRVFDEFGYELTCMGCILLTFQEKMNDGQV